MFGLGLLFGLGLYSCFVFDFVMLGVLGLLCIGFVFEFEVFVVDDGCLLICC